MPKVFLFTTHKAASSLLVPVTRIIADELEFDVRSENIGENRLKGPWSARGDGLFDEDNTVYGPLRYSLGKDLIGEEDRCILHLRDPRDALTSLFFSEAYSHVDIAEQSREAVRQTGVDNFVLARCPAFRRHFDMYVNELLGLPNCTLVHYETLVERPRQWVAQVASGIAPIADNLPGQDKKRMLRRLNIRLSRLVSSQETPEEENVNKHIRKKAAGDHIEKLKPETIEELNRIFAPSMLALGYGDVDRELVPQS